MLVSPSPVVWVSLIFFSICSANPPCFYHQKQDYTYHDNFQSRSCSQQQCSVTPFNSPDNSLDAHLLMIKEAKTNIVIANPVFKSWDHKCSLHYSSCADKSKCIGCSLNRTRNEPFKVFQALVEAMQSRNISVKILTNNFSVPTCKDETTILDWLHVNGAEIRTYASTTFLHAKFMMTDNGEKVLVSSVNFSHQSFSQHNRETGVIISNCECKALDLYKEVFEFDWKEGDTYVLTNTYSDEQIHVIKSPVDSPISSNQIETFPNVDIIQTYVAPDFARHAFFNNLNNTQHSLLIHIYLIEDSEICDQIVALHKKSGVKVSVLVSDRTLNIFQNKKIQKCYDNIKKANISLVKNKTFEFSHQKYWIIDNRDVHLSTGNWSPSDLPAEYDHSPIPANKYPRKQVNRDMLIVMRSPKIVEYFKNIFVSDGGVVV